MAEPATPLRMSVVEYLAWEREQRDKHEFHEGEVFAMAGGSPRHNYLSARAVIALDAALRGRGCRVLSSDQRIAAARGQRYVYADCVVACGELQMEPDTSDVLANPAVIVEVLSKSTERYDRGEKWASYQRLPSLTDYLLVAQGAVRVEHYRRDDGGWRYVPHEAGGTVVLANGAALDLDTLYEGALELPSD